MSASYASFELFLDGIFLISPDKKKPKKKKKGLAEEGYRRSDASAETVREWGERSCFFLYDGSDYPESIVSGLGETDVDTVLSRLGSPFPAKPSAVREKLDEKKLSLLAFRADAYCLFSPPNAADFPWVSGPLPSILVKKTALKPIEETLESGNAREDGLEPAVLADTWIISHPCEFIVSRMFLPPRATLAAHSFAAVAQAVTSNPRWPENTRHVCYKASWFFSGQPLEIRYHIDLSPSSGAQMDAMVKTIVSAFFREALVFWKLWKHPIEKPSITESPGAPSEASAFLVAEIRGEGQRIPCAVELPKGIIALVLKMAQTASLDPESPASLLDLMRANDALFLLMKAGYRKAFLANPKGDVPFSGPTLYGLLSLMDDVDKSIIIQNFLVTHYQLENIPLLFYYHAALQKSGDETVYRLRPAFPVVQGEIEEFLSDKLKQEWAYCMANGCMHRVSTAENLVALNAEAVLKLARDAVERKFILSAKALAILKEEVLAPIDAVYQREFDELAKRMDLFEPLKKATPRFITDMLAGIETRELAMACVGSEDILVLLDRGMSQGRRADIRAEVAVEKKRFERGEFSVQKLLDAKRRLIALVRNLPGAEMGAEMEADTDPEKDPEAAI